MTDKTEAQLEKIEFKMAKLREKRDAAQEELRALAAERRKLLGVDQEKEHEHGYLPPAS